MEEETLIGKILQDINSTPELPSMSLTELNMFEQYVELCILREKMKLLMVPDYGGEE